MMLRHWLPRGGNELRTYTPIDPKVQLELANEFIGVARDKVFWLLRNLDVDIRRRAVPPQPRIVAEVVTADDIAAKVEDIANDDLRHLDTEFALNVVQRGIDQEALALAYDMTLPLQLMGLLEETNDEIPARRNPPELAWLEVGIDAEVAQHAAADPRGEHTMSLVIEGDNLVKRIAKSV